MAPSRPPAATIVFPTNVAPVNERCWFRAGWFVQAFVLGSKLTTPVVVNGPLNGSPPPIAQSSPPATVLPGTFSATGMLARSVHASVAML